MILQPLRNAYMTQAELNYLEIEGSLSPLFPDRVFLCEDITNRAPNLINRFKVTAFTKTTIPPIDQRIKLTTDQIVGLLLKPDPNSMGRASSLRIDLIDSYFDCELIDAEWHLTRRLINGGKNKQAEEKEDTDEKKEVESDTETYWEIINLD